MEPAEKPTPPESFLDNLTNLAENFWLIRKRRWLRRLFFGLLTISLFTCAVAGIAFYGLYHYKGNIPYFGDLNDSKGSPLDWKKLARHDYEMQSTVEARDGEPIGDYAVEQRVPIKVNEVPPLLVHGLIAVEDQRFYSHSGIDLRAIAHAAFNNYLLGKGMRYGQEVGASTLTQQVVRHSFSYSVDSFRTREHSLKRKVKEARIAIQLEKKYSKDDIMEAALNMPYLGHKTFGFSSAARFYFRKDLKKGDLRGRDTETIRAIAILVALNKSAEKYCPIFHEPAMPEPKPGAGEQGNRNKMLAEIRGQEEYRKRLLVEGKRVAVARDRYNWVLSKMQKNGYISEEEEKKAQFDTFDALDKGSSPDLSLLQITPLKNTEFGHGVRMVKDLLLVQGFRDDDISKLGKEVDFNNFISTSGLTIKTSFDRAMQTILTEEIERQYEELNREVKTKEKIEGAGVVIHNKDGRIVAMVGSHSWEDSQFNRALSLRSPGSVFKPVTYAAAFELGKTFDDKVCNCPFSLPDKIDVHGRILKRWAPQNFPEKNQVPKGYIPLPIGLIRSINLATLDLARQIGGWKPVVEMANRLGIHGFKNEEIDPNGDIWFKRPGANDKQKGLEPYLPTVIGGSGASLLELATAFSVFARGGTYIRPTIIEEIRDFEGRVLYKAPEPKEEWVILEEVANMITELLRAVTKFGTAKISMRGIEQQVACKTGTSNGPDDLSLVCYTPEYTIMFRWGYDMPRAIELPEYMARVSHDAEMQVSAGWVVGPEMRRTIDRVYAHRTKVGFSEEIEEGVAGLVDRFGGKY